MATDNSQYAVQFQSVGSWGVRTPWGVLTAPGSRKACFVSSLGGDAYNDPEIRANIVTTLNAGAAYARDNKADTIFVLPGHTENIAATGALSNLHPGTRIVGLGAGADMATIRWTNAASNWAIDDANVSISGLRLRMEGTDDITCGITVTAADCTISGCDIQFASGASNHCAIAITAGAGADRFRFANNVFRGDTGVPTDGILISGTGDGICIENNDFFGPMDASKGFIRVSGAATNLRIRRNSLRNTTTAAVACITVADTAASGIIEWNNCAVITATSATNCGLILAGTNPTIQTFQNYTSNTAMASGILCPVATAA